MSSQPNRSLADGLALLAELAIADKALGCRPLARRMAMDPVRANRLLKALTAAGYAEQDDQRRYRPGPAFQIFAAIALHGSVLLRRGRTVLAALQEDTGLVAALGLVWGDQVVYLWHGGSCAATAPFPARTSSIGRLIAARAKGRRHAAVVHGQHRSLAVPIPGHDHAGLALTAIPLKRPLAPLITRLHQDAAQIAGPTPAQETP